MMRLSILAVGAATAAAQNNPGLILNRCSAAAASLQVWVYNATSTNIYLSTPQNGANMCMDVEGFSTAPNATIYAFPCGKGSKTNENWDVHPTYIRSLQVNGTNNCLSVFPGEIVGNGTAVTQAVCNQADPLQQLAYNAASGLIVHTPSGLCVDAGSVLDWCHQQDHASWTVCNYLAGIDSRAADIVARMSLADKIQALNTDTPHLPSISLDKYNWWSEATHGISHVNYNAQVPFASNTALPITTGCSFNRSLWRATGNLIGREARAFQNLNLAYATYWAPVINIVRDPRWGRNIETPGEDPLHVGAYAVEFVQGFEHAKETEYPLQASACCKHFVANELDGWNGTDRYHIDVYVPQQDLADSYLPSFQSCVEEGHVSGVMCSYNAVNGVPSCASDWLLGTLLRESWGFDGYVTSDCDADSDVFFSHHYTTKVEDSIAAIFKAGTDVDCGDFATKYTPWALGNGTVTEGDIDVLMRRMFKVRIRLGQFDPPSALSSIGPDQVCNNFTLEAARDGARQGTVVLKNDAMTLPLNPGAFKNVVVIGPNMDLSDTIDYYGGQPCSNNRFTPLDGVKQHFPSATGIKGVPDVNSNDVSGVPAAVAAATGADLVFLAIGSDLMLEREGQDRTSIDFSQGQKTLIQAVVAAAKGPVVALVFSGGAMDVSSLLANARIGGVVYGGQPSVQVVGVIDVVVGRTLDGRAVSAAGRMSQTSYPSEFTSAVSMFDFGMRPGPSSWPPGSNPGRTYRFYTGMPVLPFGWGLSYTTFNYVPWSGPTADLDISAVHTAAKGNAVFGHIAAGLKATAADMYMNVTNTGSLDSDTVVLGFLVPPGAGTGGVPIKQLFGFERVFVRAGQTVTVYIGMQGLSFTQVLADGTRVAWPGEYTVELGLPETESLRHGQGFASYKLNALV